MQRLNRLYINSNNCSKLLFKQQSLNIYTNRLFSTSNNEINEDEVPLDAKGQMIHNLLTNSLKPSLLNVIDMSGGCGSMYRIEIISTEFNDKSLLNQHRHVNSILKDVIPTLHGLTLVTKGDKK